MTTRGRRSGDSPNLIPNREKLLHYGKILRGYRTEREVE